MKILFLTPHPGIKGPLPKTTPLFVSGLRDLGCAVETSFWSAHSDNESLFTKITQRPGDILTVKQKVRSFRPDILVVTTTHDWKAILRDLPLLMMVRRFCPKIVLHLHGSLSHSLVSGGNHLLKNLTKKILDRCDAVFLYSREELEEWASFYPDMCYQLVDNPYIQQEIGINSGMGTQIPAILFAGRLSEEKGVFDLLGALAALKDRFQFKVLILGEGPCKEKLKEAVEMNGMKSQVSLPGYLSGQALKNAFKSASIFVLPSWREGFPLVLVEAMDFGLPIVTTRIRGAADRLVEGEHCLFVEPRDVKGLANAIARLLVDADLREKMSLNNREKVKEFAPEVVVKKYFEILKEVVSQ